LFVPGAKYFFIRERYLYPYLNITHLPLTLLILLSNYYPYFHLSSPLLLSTITLTLIYYYLNSYLPITLALIYYYTYPTALSHYTNYYSYLPSPTTSIYLSYSYSHPYPHSLTLTLTLTLPPPYPYFHSLISLPHTLPFSLT
jgi:hypothetical protein